MTLKELQAILGNQISAVLNVENRESEEYRVAMEKSDVIAKLSKQMINNADVILRADKLIEEGMLNSSSTIKTLIDK